MPGKHKCPHCGSNDLMRSRRRFAERLLFVLRPYRCRDCNHRCVTLQMPRQQNVASHS